MGDQLPVIKAAVIQAAPCLFDREATVAKACALIAEAAGQGAGLILLPEAFIPAYPRGLSFGTVVGSRNPQGRRTWERYWSNAVDVPDATIGSSPELPDLDRGQAVDVPWTRSRSAPTNPTLAALGNAARQANAFLAIGVIERDSYFSGGTLYCTLLYFGPDGRLLGKHRKLKPTAAERADLGRGRRQHADRAATRSSARSAG